MIYYVIFITICILSLGVQSSNTIEKYDSTLSEKVLSNTGFLIVLLLLVIMAGVRYNVGTDYETYSQIQIPEVLSGVTSRVEFLYQVLIKFGASLGNDQTYMWIFLLTHLFIIYPIMISYKRLSGNFSLSMFIFLFSGFYNNSLNMMRQSIAIAFFTFGILFIVKRKPVQYTIIIVIAFLFHSTAILLLPVYFLYNKHISNKIFTIIVVVILMFSSLFRQLAFWISSKMMIYSEYFINSKYSTRPILWSYVLFNLIVILILYFVSKYSILDDNQKIQINFYFKTQILLELCFLLAPTIPNSYRLSFFFLPIQGLLAPLIITKLNNRQLKAVVLFVLALLYVSFFTWTYILQNGAGTNPYQTIFQFFKIV